MEEQLMQLPEQFSWEPEVIGSVPNASRYLVCGMGGSHLAASLLLRHDPTLPLSIHRDYGLPARVEPDTLVILSSYSGNTEEVLDAGEASLVAGLPTIAITKGGRLADFAERHEMPHILLPESEVEPRMAIGHALVALATVIGGDALVSAVREAGSALAPESVREMGLEVGNALTERIPLIYASTQNAAIANFWKIAMNETAKIPAFTYAIPEFSHNELSGFDTAPATEGLSERFLAVFLTDEEDHERNTRRMEIARDLLNERGIDTVAVPLEGANGLAKALTGVATGVWAALSLAATYEVPDAQTPLIAEFKDRMAGI